MEFSQYYVESRGGPHDTVMMAGVEKLVRTFKKGITVEDVENANALFMLHFGRQLFNYKGWMTIATD